MSNKSYKLILPSGWVQVIGTQEFVNPEKNTEYLEWLAKGNTPLPADPIIEPKPLTAQQKLEAAGLTIEELKDLLGL